MKKAVNTNKNKVYSMSKSTRDKLDTVASAIRGKELFADKVEHARKTLKELKSLPI